MDHAEFLLSYGCVGDFGRFRADRPMPIRRGDRAVVRSHRGLEMGMVMRPVAPGQGQLLAGKYIGSLVRPATLEDERKATRLQARCQDLFNDSRRLASRFALSMEILDAEILLDERRAIIHYLRWADCDPRAFMDGLAQAHRVLVTLHDLRLPHEEEDEGLGGCGSGNCGAGGCGTCSSGNCSRCGRGAAAIVAKPDAALEARRVTLL